MQLLASWSLPNSAVATSLLMKSIVRSWDKLMAVTLWNTSLNGSELADP